MVNTGTKTTEKMDNAPVICFAWVGMVLLMLRI